MGCICDKQSVRIETKFMSSEIIRAELWRARLIKRNQGNQGRFQFRGRSGALVLTKDKLWFGGLYSMFGGDVEISLTDIVSVDAKAGVCCKNDFCFDPTEVVILEFYDMQTGSQDEMHLAVDCAEDWKDDIVNAVNVIKQYQLNW